MKDNMKFYEIEVSMTFIAINYCLFLSELDTTATFEKLVQKIWNVVDHSIF